MVYIAIFLLFIIVGITVWAVKNRKKIKESTNRFVNKHARKRKVIKPKPKQEDDSGDALILSDSDRVRVVGKKSNPLN